MAPLSMVMLEAPVIVGGCVNKDMLPLPPVPPVVSILPMLMPVPDVAPAIILTFPLLPLATSS